MILGYYNLQRPSHFFFWLGPKYINLLQRYAKSPVRTKLCSSFVHPKWSKSGDATTRIGGGSALRRTLTSAADVITGYRANLRSEDQEILLKTNISLLFSLAFQRMLSLIKWYTYTPPFFYYYPGSFFYLIIILKNNECSQGLHRYGLEGTQCIHWP